MTKGRGRQQLERRKGKCPVLHAPIWRQLHQEGRKCLQVERIRFWHHRLAFVITSAGRVLRLIGRSTLETLKGALSAARQRRLARCALCDPTVKCKATTSFERNFLSRMVSEQSALSPLVRLIAKLLMTDAKAMGGQVSCFHFLFQLSWQVCQLEAITTRPFWISMHARPSSTKSRSSQRSMMSSLITWTETRTRLQRCAGAPEGASA